MVQLFDDDYITIFTKFYVNFLKQNQVIITGLRDRTNGLWNIPLEPRPPAQQSSKRSHPRQANGIIRYDTNKRELDKHFHTSDFSPVRSTFITTIKGGHLTTWTGFYAIIISKHLPQSTFTVKGHLGQEQNYLRSTHYHQYFLDNFHPRQEECTHNIIASIIDVNSATDKSYSGQTGKFLVLSSRGNQYIFFLYNYDTKSIHAHLLKNRQTLDITTSWTTCHKNLPLHGATPTLHILDNECSHTMKK